MTALTGLQRLETFGIWHSSPTARRRDVVVQLGEATLTISDPNMTALTHWSLPAVLRLNPGEMPAHYAPSPDQSEILELEDETMVGAIEKVLASVQRRRAEPRRLRRSFLIGGAAALLLAGALWLPGALVSEALAVAPPAKRTEIGNMLLDRFQARLGGHCADPLGRAALAKLRSRLLPQAGARIFVLKDGPKDGRVLPGGILVLGGEMVLAHDDPAVLAGQILALDEAGQAQDPLRLLLEDAGILATLQLLTTGSLSARHIDRHAEDLLVGLAAPTPAGLAARLGAAGIPAEPLLAALRASRPEMAKDLAGQLDQVPPLPAGGARTVLTDSDWVALQQICQQ